MNFNATFIGQLIAFAVFVVFCMKYVWPPLMAAIEERQKKIADGLEASERAEKDLELAQAKATEQMKDAKIGQALPATLDAAFAADWSLLYQALLAPGNLFVIGRGLGLGPVLEMALKLFSPISEPELRFEVRGVWVFMWIYGCVV